MHTFKEELTGPEYAARFIDQVRERNIEFKLNTMVLDIAADRTVTAMNRQDGMMSIAAGAVILAMGCRERPRGALNIPGFRPAGIFSAGTAQRLVNIEGYMPGKRIVILGSGDIGLIMARRMTLEGAKVLCVAELMPYSGGLKRNIVQCLNDYNIPLLLSHTVVDIRGKQRVEGVTIAKVDDRFKPIPGTETDYDCDTLMLSTGLIPENELSRNVGIDINPITNGPFVAENFETSVPGIFACGNVLHVHDLVDFVSEEAGRAGRAAAAFVSSQSDDITNHKVVRVITKGGVRYTVPTSIDIDRMTDSTIVRFRVANVFQNHYINVYIDDTRIIHQKKRIMAPGEMEQAVLKKSQLQSFSNIRNITIAVESE